MVTLRRSHAPVPWGAQVEMAVWERSQPGTPRRGRSDRPPLTHDPGWDWDGTRILSCGKTVVPDREERGCEVCRFQLLEDEDPTPLPGRTHVALSLLDIARYQATKKRTKARSGLDDFEVIKVPKVVPISEEEFSPGDSRGLSDWEKLDAFVFKRTYSEVAQGFVGGKDPLNTPGYSQLALSGIEDNSWECL